jgi:serine phosphatase RsbU (regulator of sigma subunit)
MPAQSTPAAQPKTDSNRAHAMACMEIWGGNHEADEAVSVPGVDAWVVSKPHEQAEQGGDIHYVSTCGQGRISRFVIADVSGHGAPVADLSSSLRSLMRRHINTIDQSRFARALNEEFAELSTDGLFATALAATYFSPTDHLIICNAGHPRPLWWSARRMQWTILDHEHDDASREVANLPLGIIEPTEYHQFAAPLAPGDLVLIYTDAFLETAAPEGDMLGEQGLIDVLSDLDPTHPSSLLPALFDRVARISAPAPAADDATALLLHHNAFEAPRQSLAEKLRVMSKMIGLSKV